MANTPLTAPDRGDPGRHDPEDSLRRDGARIRLARLARGVSQQELARAAGISRQAVAGLEAGQWDPSLRVALAIARALGQSVEELFGPPTPEPAVEVTPLAAPAGPACRRAELARVGSRMVALPLSDDRAFRPGFLTAGGFLEHTRGRAVGPWTARPTVPQRPTLVVAGCDPALPLLAAPLASLDPPIGLSWWHCGSQTAMELASAGLVHVAGVHSPGVHSHGRPAHPDRVRSHPERARRAAQRADTHDRGFELVSFAEWSEGLAFRRGEAAGGLAEAASRGMRLVGREPGSEARALLERQMAKEGLGIADVEGLNTNVAGHLLVASAIAGRLGDVGVVAEPAALCYGLEFLELSQERSVLALPRRLLDTPEIRALLRVLASPGLSEQLATLPGYRGAGRCGEILGSLDR